MAETANVAYLTIQMTDHRQGKPRDDRRHGRRPLGRPGRTPISRGRPILQGHYEAIADERTGLTRRRERDAFVAMTTPWSA